MAKVEDVIQRGDRASQPTPTTGTEKGIIYYVTDENVTERWSGTAWQDISDVSVPAEITSIPTAETNTAKVLHPDGVGGVAWGTDATGGGGGGGAGITVYQTVEGGTGATNTATIAAAASGHLIWVYLDSYNTADPAAMTATNCTFTKLKTTTDGGGAIHSLWVGKVSGGASGTTITFTNSNASVSYIIIETDDPTTVTPTLTSSASADRSGGNDQYTQAILQLGATASANKLAVFYCGPANTSAGNGAMLFPSIEAVGIAGARCSLLIGVIPDAVPLSCGLMIFQPTGSHFVHAILEVG